MIKHFFSAITGNVVSLIGTLMIVTSLLLIGALLMMQAFGYEGGAYVGILTFVLMPMFFLMGIALVPIGLWWRKRRDAKLAARARKSGTCRSSTSTRKAREACCSASSRSRSRRWRWPRASRSRPSTTWTRTNSAAWPATRSWSPSTRPSSARRTRGSVARAATSAPGAEWFVKAKISGSWQLVAVAFDLYPRPIPTPVHSLRPSSGTCEQCHWPTKFLGDRLKVRTHYAEDEANTELKTALMVKVGGKVAGQSQGIHWHVDPNHRVRYRADPTREIMYEVELTDLVEGTTKVFKGEEPAPEGAEWRTMDCVDCHNRASHIYRSPEFELDLALEEGRIDRSLPYIRKEGLRIITEKEYDSHAAAREGIAAAVQAFYAQNYPDLAGTPAVEQAGKALGDAYAWNNFPHMKVKWNTYPNHIGHQESPGCFRCHDNKHKTDDGEKIGKKCGTCHKVVADEEYDSALLQELGIQEPPPAPAELPRTPEAAATTAGT